MLQKKLLISSWFGTIGTTLKTILLLFFIFFLIYQFISHSGNLSVRKTAILFVCLWFELWFAIITDFINLCVLKNKIKNWKSAGKLMTCLSLLSFFIWTSLAITMNSADNTNLKTAILMMIITTFALIAGCTLWLTKNKQQFALY